ncbi:hypothetical protein BDV95DRAFT_599418 [Massariosphaeria phaeospora]|uniref:Transmembrane protein n=1 Tax=Massariosphaeria phaeospora TaxID=100035 RepID=A0A7C8M2M4_9PLEO|nr:hypothetical protein BDV95DRAFT_599418 [Massariosphaeria phaeospora]
MNTSTMTTSTMNTSTMSTSKCDPSYFDLASSDAGWRSVGLSFALLALPAIICTLAHSAAPDGGAASARQPAMPSPAAGEPASESGSEPEPAPATATSPATNKTRRSPATRAARLAWTTVFTIPLCVVLGYRVADILCMDELTDGGYAAWGLVAVFNFVPFAVGALAWLGCLIDCLLVRLDPALTWEWWWPFAGVAMVPFVAVYIPFMVFAYCAAGLAGVSADEILPGGESSASAVAEPVGEEALLMADMDGQDGEDGAGPPAYKAVNSNDEEDDDALPAYKSVGTHPGDIV